MGEVDYSPNDFRQAKAAIEDAATRQQQSGSTRGSRRVRQFGDTTVITEHPDPYSFYWQLDKLKKAEEEAARPVPPADYVLEEEEEEEPRPEEEEAEEYPEDYLSPDSGVHLVEQREEQHYARPVKEWEPKADDLSRFSHYWHVDSAPPRKESPPPMAKRRSPSPPPSPTPIMQPPQRAIARMDAAQQTKAEEAPPLIEEHAFKQTTTRRRVELAEEEEEEADEDGGGREGMRRMMEEGSGTGQARHPRARFVVRPLGHLEVADAELVDAERSQRVLNEAIAELGRGAERDDEIELELTETELCRRARAEGGRVLGREQLGQIRVWGVGGVDGRDFAYVAPASSAPEAPLLCRVFRCTTSAKLVADALRNACDALLRQKRQRRPETLMGTRGKEPEEGRRRRRRARESSGTAATPMADEAKRIIRCHFIGVTQVPRAMGIETLNEAVDKLVKEVGPERWTLVDVHISPSVISIFEAENARRQVASCRVRYLSFLGIGRDVKHCAFIVAQSSDHFVCYVFHAPSSAGPLAKTIEAACKLRYQKVLDAHLGPNGGMK